MKTFRIRLYLASIFSSSVGVTQIFDTFPVDSIDCCVSWWYCAIIKEIVNFAICRYKLHCLNWTYSCGHCGQSSRQLSFVVRRKCITVTYQWFMILIHLKCIIDNDTDTVPKMYRDTSYCFCIKIRIMIHISLTLPNIAHTICLWRSSVGGVLSLQLVWLLTVPGNTRTHRADDWLFSSDNSYEYN